MTLIKGVGTLLDEFSGMGERHYFCLRSGQPCEGWIVTVEEDSIYFLDCESVKEAGEEAEPIKLRLGAVDLETLEYLDPAQTCWVSVQWDGAGQRWIETPVEQPSSSGTKGVDMTAESDGAPSPGLRWSNVRSTLGQLFQRPGDSQR
jgi:hypothetical protein